ncbi:hypothetical protein F441_22806 [Phytophthora nicotianae CJ01A1]|uniref:Uncharacterized protein n=1 Tax=Phytophthora nicotianae CJ01A1 TaxID=1317063 RepID=W2VN43_PHYNI|nr:hypothetical protein F441_22806 [Phytophthora nicotianae CJ01A1]
MEHILGFFKAKNNDWEQIKSVVIDKDIDADTHPRRTSTENWHPPQNHRP